MRCRRCDSTRLIRLDKKCSQDNDVFRCQECGFLFSPATPADTLLQRNEPGDREKAVSLLEESLAISSELGMRPLMERVLSRREILKA